MAEDGVSKSQAFDQTHEAIVPFGDNYYIDPTKALPEFNNGKALAYAAFDDRDKTRRVVAVISSVEQFVRWKSIKSYDNLTETSVLRLLDHGVILWSLLNKECYVLLYDVSGLGECIVKPGEFSKVGWRNPEVIDFLINPVIAVLKDMAQKGFSHGSIRSSNIFFNGNHEKKKPVVLGDCLSVCPHSTQPTVYLPIERAMAEPYGRGDGSLSSDIYALGVSIAMFLRKNDELKGLSDKDILRKKIELGSYTAIVGSERFQTTFVEFLRGVLHDDPQQRWGLEEIISWLDGTRITPPGLIRRKKANRPFNFGGRKYLHSDTLAMDLPNYPSEVIKVIESGDLEQWIEKAFNDKELHGNFERAIEKVSVSGGLKMDNIDFIITHICMALNPMLPINYKGRVFAYDGMGYLMAKSSYEGQDLSVFKEALQRNILDQAASMKTIPQNEVISYVKSFDLCRGILRQKSNGGNVEKCMYSLCPSAPCFSPMFKYHFVYDAKSCLRAYEGLSARGRQSSIFVDAHCMAFFSVHDSRLIEGVLFDLSSTNKDKRIAGNLRFLAAMQKKAKINSLPAIAKVFLSSLEGVYEVYHNLKLRKQISEGVKREAQKGNLVGMSGLIENNSVRMRDAKAFLLARREFQYLRNEYNQYNRKLADKSTYGVVNGREAASLVSWIIATGITVLSVFAYFSGYRVF